MCLLDSVQYDRIFLIAVPYENLLNVFIQRKLNGAIAWVYNNDVYCPSVGCLRAHNHISMNICSLFGLVLSLVNLTLYWCEMDMRC